LCLHCNVWKKINTFIKEVGERLLAGIELYILLSCTGIAVSFGPLRGSNCLVHNNRCTSSILHCSVETHCYCQISAKFLRSVFDQWKLLTYLRRYSSLILKAVQMGNQSARSSHKLDLDSWLVFDIDNIGHCYASWQ